MIIFLIVYVQTIKPSYKKKTPKQQNTFYNRSKNKRS